MSSTILPEFRWSGRAVAAGLALVVVSSASAVIGTMSTFTSSQTKGQSVGSGTFSFSLSDPGSAPFATTISGLAPGDAADRLVTLTNGGGIGYASVGLGTTAPSTSSLLDTDATNGLTIAVDACSQAWTQASTGVAATCGATTTALTAATAVATLKSTPPSWTSGLGVLTGGGADYLRFHYVLPAVSVGTAGASTALVFTFTATQAAGGAYH